MAIDEMTTTTRSASEGKVQETFGQIWAKSNPEQAAQLDPMSRDIAAIVLSLLPKNRACSILEAGSGTGRISAILAKAGHHLTLLDVSRESFEISRLVFRSSWAPLRAIQASMFQIPMPDETYDVVWNAGVIEHFYFEEQVKALREMVRVLKPKGTLITLNPSAHGRIYRLGKYISEKRGTWQFGQEFPVESLRSHCQLLGLELLEERDVLPHYQFSFFPRPASYFVRIGRSLPLFQRATLFLAGGYLRLSVVRKG